MTACYWDTSGLLALLFEEDSSPRVRNLAFRDGGLPGWTSFFTFLEMESAFARRLAEGSLSRRNLPALRMQARLIEAALSVIWPDAEILDEARRFVFGYGLRPADSLQLASARVAARHAAGARFACLDFRLVDAARAVGIECVAL